jgi:hypothetical protein
MAIDSNFSGDDPRIIGATEKAAAAGLKLVSERGSRGEGAGADPGPGRSTKTASDAQGDQDPSGHPLAGRDRKQGRRVPLWLVAALLVLFLMGYGYQTHQAGKLQGEVLRLQEALTSAESRLESHRTHLLEIRSGVQDLSTRMEALRALIDQDPTAPPASAPASEPASEPAAPGQP